ncbi:MAG: hypothetical protein KY475_15075, partial [Planctomycetes bacterium]|nr:hypothetical protein [Planctomycetota bacterium]
MALAGSLIALTLLAGADPAAAAGDSPAPYVAEQQEDVHPGFPGAGWTVSDQPLAPPAAEVAQAPPPNAENAPR